MVVGMKNWFKIYLFYGMIFFSLGLASIFLSKTDLWPNTTVKIRKYVDIFRAYTNLDKDFQEQEVAVFGPGSQESCVHLILGSHLVNQYSLLNRHIREDLKQRYQKIIIYPVIDSDRLFSNILEILTKSSVEKLFGLEITPDNIMIPDNMKDHNFPEKRLITLFFLVSAISEEEMGAELGLVLKEFEEIRLSRIKTSNKTIYRISWESDQAEMESAQTIIEVLEAIDSFNNVNSI